MSKTNKSCSYVLLKGKREGELCGRPCRGDLCGDHNKNKKEYSKKYYKKKNDKRGKMTHKQKIRRLQMCTINKLPSLNYCGLRIKGIEEAAKELIMRILGIGIIADPENYEHKLEEKIKRDRENDKIIPSKHYIEFAGDKDLAKEELTKMLDKRDLLVKRLKQANEIYDVVEDRLK